MEEVNLGFYKKTVLLSNQGDCGKGMAILTIEKNNGGIFGSLKVFDILSTNNLMLGISVNDKQVYRQKIYFSNGNVYNFRLDDDIDVDGKIGSVIVSVNNNNINALLWGTNGCQAKYKQDIINFFEKDYKQDEEHNKKDISIESPKITVAEQKEDFEVKNDDGFDAKLFESTDEEIEEIVDNNIGGEFYELIHEQIDELFKRFPRDDDLQRLIPNSKWVKVDYESNGKDYVFGLIFDNEKVNYICYGVPGSLEALPSEEIRKYSQWMSIDSERNTGYWLMYQNADTGESISFEDVKLSQ